MKTILFILLLSHASIFAGPKVIHLFVALCDNASQGIAPVGERIGDGNKPDDNLYWGCSDGVQKYFSKSKLWKKLEVHKPQTTDGNSPILRRIIFKHKRTGAILIAEAYQGKHIKQCLTDYLNSSTGSHKPTIAIKSLNTVITAGGASQLTAYIGHNALMEYPITTTAPAEGSQTPSLDTITLCCISDRYFKSYFSKTKTSPILQTRSLMYPGSFILHETLEGWFRRESKAKLRTRAAKAYAKNQKISLKGGYSIFQKIESNSGVKK